MKKLYLALLYSLAAVLPAFGIWLHADANILADESVGAALPPGFAITRVVDGLSLPVDMEFMPSGDILIAQKGRGDEETGWSDIRLIRNGVLQPTPLLTLSSNTYEDSGIHGIVLDPDFSENGYLYIWYATGEDAPYTPPEPVNRLIRFTVDAEAGTIAPESYVIILDNMPHASIHNGGGMQFGQDGTLYIGTGDGNSPERAQDLTSYRGKILRIRPTDDGYEIPEDNPFVDVTGAKPEIYAVGLRNPWRMTTAPDGTIYIADVGQDTWEELNRLLPSANYGWSLREGPCRVGERLPCNPTPDDYTTPAMYYSHTDDVGGGAITGITFYQGDGFPDEYKNKLFFADYDRGALAVADVQTESFSIDWLDDGVDRIVDMAYFRNNLYWLDIRAGAVFMLYHTGTDNVAPVAALDVTTASGPAPLAARFSAASAYDPDGTVLTYIFSPGDGSPSIESRTPEIDHVYTTDGTYTATLMVRDIRGATSAPVQQEITVYSGAWPAIELVNATEAGRTQFHGGDRFVYGVRRDGDTDDLDPDQPYTWRIDLLHNEHNHPEIVGVAAITGTLDIPTENHGGDADLGYRFTLTMQTATEQSITVSREIFPEVIDVTVETDPPGNGSAYVVGAPRAFPFTFPAIVGMHYPLEAEQTLLTSDSVYGFSAWSYPDGEIVTTDPELTLVVPDKALRLIAEYQYLRPAEQIYLPGIVNDQ